MDFVEKWNLWVSNLQGNKRRSVHFDNREVIHKAASSENRLPWQEITAVYAYKKDCISTDQIRVLLGNESQQLWIETTEDDEGYEQLILELPRYLPGCLPSEDWWHRVAMPPFETHWTELYRRV